ncbi:F-box protein [Phanerochaete sordida]|uniref:F-box protein n=1 Tax=Phanerochaete sordida TaxID=48140 RepID=A0A9P3G922_9APHY|nr:F-box protein [Phanerochaete sordida]
MQSTAAAALRLSEADAAIADAQEEVRRAQERLRSLASYRNTLLPIEALPEEIILDIFNILVHSTFGPSYGWLAVTHVCRRWRTAALGCPVLWTRVHCAFPDSGQLDRLDAFIERSQSCPIDVDLPLNMSWCYNTSFKRLLEQRHRWRIVKAFEIGPGLLFEVPELRVSKLALPLAIELDVHFGDFGVSRDLDEITNPSLPALKRLTSNFVRWPVLKTWMVPTLVHLEISGYGHLHTTSLSDWIDALRPLSSLQTLSLRNTFDHLALDEDTANAPPSPEPIHLPFLRTLRLVALPQTALSACISLAEHIVSPWYTEVKIEAQRPLEVDAPGYEVPFATMAARMGVSISSRPIGEDHSAVSLLFSWIDGAFHMKVLDTRSTPERALLDMQLPVQRYDHHRAAVDGIVARVVQAGPSLCSASRLLLANLGTGRRVWSALKTSSVPQLLIWRKAFPAFLDALEDDPGAFMPELDFLSISSLPRRSRLPKPRPARKAGQAQRQLLQRLADALAERRSLGLGPTSVNLGHGEIEIVAEQSDPSEASDAVEAGITLRHEEDEDDLSLLAMFGSC